MHDLAPVLVVRQNGEHGLRVGSERQVGDLPVRATAVMDEGDAGDVVDPPRKADRPEDRRRP